MSEVLETSPNRGSQAFSRRALGYLFLPVVGAAVLMMSWWLCGLALASNAELSGFSRFGPTHALPALWQAISSGSLIEAAAASLYRILFGLGWAILLGIPIGILIGQYSSISRATQVPFQFLRMISPLSWMPIAVLLFDTWNGAIIFLLTAATVWPIMFSTAHGITRIDQRWLKIAKNLGANTLEVLRDVVIPAVARDTLTGIRLALGVAWIILVPAEFLGVTSGLGYAINDARDTLEYDRLAATIFAIGAIGFLLDFLLLVLIKHFSWSENS